MDRVNTFVRDLWRRPSPPSFSHSTRGSRSRSVLRRRATAADLVPRNLSPTTQAAFNAASREEMVQSTSTKKEKRKGNAFSFKDLFRWQSVDHPPSSDQLPKDTLPHDSAALDGLVNFHLGQLERIKRELKHYNRTSDQLTVTYAGMCERSEMPGTTEQLKQRIQGVLNARNLLSRFVMFHLQELERILSLKTELGKGRTVPNLSVIQFPLFFFFSFFFVCVESHRLLQKIADYNSSQLRQPAYRHGMERTVQLGDPTRFSSRAGEGRLKHCTDLVVFLP